jgi:large subunit ribosomal protein L3
MAGRMGGERVTVKGLTVVKVDVERNLLFIRGAVPGARNAVLRVIKG